MSEKDELENSFKYLLVSRATRSVALIFSTLAMPLYLSALGYKVVFIGVMYFFMMLLGAVISITLGLLGDRIGYKNILIIGEIIPFISLSILTFTGNFIIIIIAAAFGGISGTAGGMRGAFSPGTTALIASNWRNEKDRVNKIGKLTAVGSAFSVFGSMMISLHGWFSGLVGVVDAFRFLFGLSAVLVGISIISLLLVKEKKRPKKESRIMKKESGIYSIKVLLANIMNGFGLGLALPLLPLWFAIRYNVNSFGIGIAFTGTYITTALASYYASKFAYNKKFNALFAATFSRTIQGGMIIAIAFMPTFFLAALLYALRGFIAGFGAPSRTAINMRGVNDQDYGTASSIQGLGGRFAQTSSGLSGYLMDIYTPLPLFIGGLFQTVGSFVYFALLKPKTKT